MPLLIAATCRSQRFDELAVGEVAVHHGAVHGEIGRVDLQDQPGLVDRLVFVPHLARDGVEIGVVRGVVGVEHGRGDDAGRGRGHEPLGERAELAAMRLKPRDLVGDRLDVEVVELALRLRRVLLALVVLREAAHQIGEQLRELLELAAAPALGDAAEAGHALRHVGLEADPLLLAVVADVDAGCASARSTTWRTALSISASSRASSYGLPASCATSRSDSVSLRGRLPTWVVRMRSRLKIMSSLSI